MGCSNDVLNLPAIEVLTSQPVERPNPTRAGFRGYPRYELLPQIPTGVAGKWWVLDCKMNPRLESRIKRADAISSEEHNTFVVLEDA